MELKPIYLMGGVILGLVAGLVLMPVIGPLVLVLLVPLGAFGLYLMMKG